MTHARRVEVGREMHAEVRFDKEVEGQEVLANRAVN